MIRIEDPVKMFRDYVLNRGYEFAYGSSSFINMFNEQITTLVGLSPIQTSTIIGDISGRITDYSYTTDLFIGQLGSVGDTYDDKYFERLNVLKTELVYMINELSCKTIDLISVNFTEFINQYDANIDGISAKIQFTMV